MNPSCLTPDGLFPYKTSETTDDSLTPYKMALLVLVSEYFQYRKRAQANQNGYRTLLKGLKLLSTGGSDREENSNMDSLSTPDVIGNSIVEDTNTTNPTPSKPNNSKQKQKKQKQKEDEPQSGDEDDTAVLTEKCKCDFAIMLLSLLQSGEVEFRKLLSRVEKVAKSQFSDLYQKKMTEILSGGVHAFFDFREKGIDSMLQVDEILFV